MYQRSIIAILILIYGVLQISPAAAQGKCNALGYASAVEKDKCAGNAPPGMMAKATADAQKKADEQCSKGEKCEGKSSPISQPFCVEFHAPDKGPLYHMWIATAAHDGVCSK
jgi:hypothetical protein